MHKLPLLFTAILFLLIGTSCSKKTTDVAGADDDGIDWVARAKQYRADPAALKMFTEECEENAVRLENAQRELATYRNQAGSSTQALETARAEAAAARQQNQVLLQENQQLRQQLTAVTKPNDQVDTDQSVVQGVVFQVQLGAYAQNRVDPDLATEDALELQDQNGLQKVVVSQFRTYTNAARLRDRLKVMGVRDAFIVAKNNGQRIPVDQALQITGQN